MAAYGGNTMFRLPITLLLILSLASIANAGLNHGDAINSAIAVYYFEGLEDDSNRYTTGELQNGASLTQNGIHGQGLQLTREGMFKGNVDEFPLLLGLEFSITVRVKISQQENASLHLGMTSITNEGIFPTSSIVLCVTPEGNIKAERGEITLERGPGTIMLIETEDSTLADGEWHHIAFTKYGHIYSVFIDGKTITSIYKPAYFSTKGDVFVVNAFISQPGFNGNAIIDNLGFFEVGFSPFEINAMYQRGLYEFLNVMPVDPQGKVATTWGKIKSQ